MRQSKLNKQEKGIERALLNGEYVKLGQHEFNEIARAVASRKRDAVLNIRVNSEDVKSIKQKAHRLGVKYQTFISELLHHVAHS